MGRMLLGIFVNLRRAYATIDQNVMWQILEIYGVWGKYILVDQTAPVVDSQEMMFFFLWHGKV